MSIPLLEDIGLTKSEIAVYRALLRIGVSPSGKITKQTGLYRSRVYETLQRLGQKGLVSSVVKNGVTHFEAAPPERLLTVIDEQRKVLDERESETKELIKKIKQDLPVEQPAAEAFVFLGKEGFKTMREDVLSQKKTLHLIGAKGKENIVLHYFFPGFNKRRIAAGIHMRVLFDFGVKGESTRLPLMETRFLPEEYSTPTVVNVYGDRVVSVLWKEDYPLCFMVRNKDIADSYRKWFELLWEYSK